MQSLCDGLRQEAAPARESADLYARDKLAVKRGSELSGAVVQSAVSILILETVCIHSSLPL